MHYTQHIQLPQWVESDRIMMSDFNDMVAKIDEGIAAVAEDVEETAEAISWRKVLDLTLEAETQKWNIDMSGIDLSQYQKLVIYPRLIGNNNQRAYLRMNGLTSGYSSPNNATNYCGVIPMMNTVNQQRFGMGEFTFLIDLPKLYIFQMGVTSNTSPTIVPEMIGYRCPDLADGINHIDTLNLWFDNSDYHLLPGSTVQVHGIKK